ncbi:major capsid protein [Peromfec virus RodF8_36]|uniref:Major capsid protein n=1 Tax=Peromfec virus RodF8_36 TaxID=2929371 RepID=A0A976N0N9_9VIRU|nr:major capsid protein [Peromfec virus RodF8_36]
MSNRFAENPIINITRSRFTQNHQLKTTFNAGELIPIMVKEIIPGDTIKLETSCVIRMSTPIKPVMDNAFIDIYFFFVPNRITWEHWEEFQGANKTGYWTQQTEYTIPQTTAPAETGWTKGTIADYMGIPTKVPGLSINSLPFRAYCQIGNDWFRDENLQSPTYINTDDSTTTGTNGNNYITDPITGGKPLPVAKPHDYFTSALPEPQKGPDVTLPLGTTAPVTTGAVRDVTNNAALTWATINGSSITRGENRSIYGWSESGIANNLLHTYAAPTNDTSLGGGTMVIPANLYANLEDATAATINNLRQAFQLQKMFEKDARGGTRYTEILKNHFGVTASDARLQRSEYLGGKRITINMTQVTQTSSTDSESPQGNTAAFSLTNAINASFTKSFEEHGYVIGVACVRTMHTYQQGLNKMFSRKTRTDFYMPVFANIGEQPILNKEIYAQGNSQDNEVFGYQEAWADYRYTPNQVTGEFRSNVAENAGLSIWHYADDFKSLPTLGSDFIKETKENIDRTLAVQSSVSDQFLADFYFKEIDTRPMPVYSIPGLIDHH